MNSNCPNLNCNFFKKNNFVVKDGTYFRRDDSRTIQRFKCSACLRRFSRSTSTLEFKQKKRRVNNLLYHLLSSGLSMRRSAIILRIHRTTVQRKFIYLSKKAKIRHQNFLSLLNLNKVTHMQFDDLITNEHTKLKPLSVTVAIDAKRRFILGIQVSKIPSFGHLAHISRAKYGKRKSQHLEKMNKLFKQIKEVVAPTALIESDEHKRYPEMVKRYFPNAQYKQYKGGRGCVAGQGELKKLHYDPLFKLNHTCAMLRANINRLIRKTWCTTKSPQMLKRHLDIFIHYHNTILLK